MKNRLINQIVEIIESTSTNGLTVIIGCCGFLVAIIFGIIGAPTNKIARAVEFCVVGFIWSTAGIVYILRKEVPFIIFTLRGKFAVAFGILFTLMLFVAIIAVFITNAQ